MEPYVMAKDLYKFKLALILGRGKRLKKILHEYPTEKKFKKASLEEIASVVGIKNLNSNTLLKLKKLDRTYDKMVTFKNQSFWSNDPQANVLMGIDTEYLKSGLDCIQYVIMDQFKPLTAGIIFTNNQLAPSVDIHEGIETLRSIISEYQPELMVGHNFNSDISILEKAYGYSIPELYYYDDTMDLMEKSNLANIIGGFALNKAIKEVFSEETVGLFTAYGDLSLLMEYGIKDALYPILLRYYILNGEMPEMDFEIKIDNIIQEENRGLLEKDSFEFSFE
mgnify:CR=1 FL=1